MILDGGSVQYSLPHAPCDKGDVFCAMASSFASRAMTCDIVLCDARLIMGRGITRLASPERPRLRQQLHNYA